MDQAQQVTAQVHKDTADTKPKHSINSITATKLVTAIKVEEWVTVDAAGKNLALHIYCFFFTQLASAYIAIRFLW